MGYYHDWNNYTHGGILLVKSGSFDTRSTQGIRHHGKAGAMQHETDTTQERHDAEAKRKVINRLRRAHGQLAAVINAVEQDAHCRDVVHQLSAVSKALDRAGFLVVSSALKECLNNPEADGAPDQDELEKLFLTLA